MLDKEMQEKFHEFCPKCEANLTLQKRYNNKLPYWVCKGCGEMLINPNVPNESDIAWICDKCETMLNCQDGFTENNGEWKCIECGFVNKIDERNIYMSNDEYIEDLKNPYKGMPIEDVIELMNYEHICYIKDKPNVHIVKNHCDNKLYVKKFLDTYEVSVYEYLRDNPIAHMPKIKSIHQGDNYLVIIEEYVIGITLSALIDQGNIESIQAVNIAKQVSIIISDLHNLDRPIIHRDIKPSNIIVTEDKQIYLLDFNVAKWYKADEKEDTRLLGTLYYAAPEQYGYGFKASSAKTDIYPLGIILNEMITGKVPKEERAPAPIWDIVEKCISLNPENRYTDEELIKALDNIMR